MSRPPLAFLASAGLVVAGLLGGALFDPHPGRPPAHRAGFRVLEADLHAHTSASDGSLSPFALVRQAERRGLDVLGVTEHNTVVPGLVARAFAEASGGPLVVPGEEVTTSRFHLVALGIERTVSPNQGARAVLDDIHAQGGVGVAAHPVRRFWGALAPVRDALDATEVMHPIAFAERGAWRWEDMLAFHSDGGGALAAIGSSDYHWGSVLGLCRTLVFVREPVTPDSVRDALREGRTVVLDRGGEPIGPPSLVEALRREPYEPRRSDYAYRGEGPADRILRALGWLGVLGVALLRPRRRAR